MLFAFAFEMYLTDGLTPSVNLGSKVAGITVAGITKLDLSEKNISCLGKT